MFAAVWRLFPVGHDAPGARRIVRRGVHHGVAVQVADTSADDDADLDVAGAWAQALPIALPGILAPALPSLAPCIAASCALFAHLRAGGRFLDAVLELLDGNPEFRPEGSTFDRHDPREIEKVFVSGLVDGKCARGGRDVWAKLAWIAHDESDLSLRIRFSCGTEQLHDWQGDIAGQQWADRLAQTLFPECAALAQNPELIDVVQQVLGTVPRFSERIVYSNAPGGGAVFHHDADATQRGVAYGQLHGATAWLALPRHELVAHIVAHAAATARADLPHTADAACRRLDATDDDAMSCLLNADPAFSRRLADAGWLFVLEAGDALLLPSHDRERVAWHGVFALGDEPSLAHSYGLFPAT
jgi:hypothetical protein